MLSPKRTKFRKLHKGRIKGEAKGGTDLNFGSFGLKAIEPERITARQIESARRAMTRHMKRQGRVWIRIFPDTPVTQKPTEVRMGKGKGSVEYWAAKVKPGRVMFEIDGVAEPIAREALRLAAMKLPIKSRDGPARRLVRLGECRARRSRPAPARKDYVQLAGKSGVARGRPRLYATASTMNSTGTGRDPFGALLVMLKGRPGNENAQELRDKTPDQLREQLEGLKKEAFNLRFQQATGQLENTAQMRTVRRNAARVKTILNEKARAAAIGGVRCRSESCRAPSSATRTTRPSPCWSSAASRTR